MKDIYHLTYHVVNESTGEYVLRMSTPGMDKVYLGNDAVELLLTVLLAKKEDVVIEV